MSNFLEHINPLGRPPKYDTPERLWNKFVEYCKWCDDNPIELPAKVIFKGTKSTIEERNEGKTTARTPYLLSGFMVWAKIANWTDFKKSKTNQSGDFPRVIRAIEDTIQTQQVSGAMVGLYNSNLTARLNGIKENADLTSNGKDIVKEPLQIEVIYSENQADKKE